MAINLNDFNKTKYPGLYKSKNRTAKGYKYLAWFKHEQKLYKKLIGYSEKDHLTDRSANLVLQEYRQKIEYGFNPTEDITLNELFIQYYETHAKSSWLEKKRSIFDAYIGDSLLHKRDSKRMTKTAKENIEKYKRYKIGNMRISNIKEMHIRKILVNMERVGLTPRTRKSVLEVLNPLFEFAIRNKIFQENPAKDITVKLSNQKRIVTDATEKFKKVNDAIHSLYKDTPYYKALFLFGFTGRRKSEVLGLKWHNIDFQHNYYWLENTKNFEKQKYELPMAIREALLEIPDERKGLVFKSPITGEKLKNTDRQMRKLKKITNIDNLSFHYMRNILVSALAENDIEAIVLSGILGHSDVNTINKYLSVNHFKSSQKGNQAIDQILKSF